MGKNVIVALTALIVIVGATFVFTSKANDKNEADKASTTSQNSSTAVTSDNTTSENASDAQSVITYDGQSFSPETITVRSGTKVTIKNTSNNTPVEFDSDPHPAHTTNKELNVDLVEPGKSMTFTAIKKGTFGYHNHLQSSERGIIIVE